MQKRHKAAWARWQRVVREQEASGLNVAEFCRQRDLCAPQLFAWRRKLREAESSFVAVEVFDAESSVVLANQHSEEIASNRDASQAARAVVVPSSAVGAQSSTGASIEIRLSGGRSVMALPGFDAHHLRAVIRAVESAGVATPSALSHHDHDGAATWA